MAKKKSGKKAKSSKEAPHKTSITSQHPDHTRLLPKLNRVEGQLSGVKKMIDERRYCPDIIQQVRAARKALFSIESSLLEKHMGNCVSDALEAKNTTAREEKLFEIMQIFKSADSQGIEF